MEISIIDKDNNQFNGLWDLFLQDFEFASPFYSQLWCEYQISYSEDALKKDLSIILVDKNNNFEPLLICPLYLEEYDGIKQLSYRGEYLKVLRTPLISRKISYKQRKKVESYFFTILDNYSKRFEFRKICFLIDPLCQIFETKRYNYLTKYDYYDCSMQTRIIDLSKSVEDLWSSITRHSYRSLINKQSRLYDVIVLDENSDKKYLKEIHDTYVEFHHKTAGRITRPIKTFDLQLEMIKNGIGFMIALFYNKKTIGINYYINSQHSGYYASSADDPDIELEVPTGHLIQWEAINYMKKIGIKYFELDNQYFGNQIFEHPSQKEISISKFKAGFGGENMPLFRGIKYYDKELFKEEMHSNIKLSLEDFNEQK